MPLAVLPCESRCPDLAQRHTKLSKSLLVREVDKKKDELYKLMKERVAEFGDKFGWL